MATSQRPGGTSIPPHLPPLWAPENAALLICICSEALFEGILTTMLTPILPDHASSIGASRTMVVVLFALFPFAVLISSPGFGWMSGSWGREGILYTGLLISGVGAIVFGYTHNLIILCITRFITGLGSAATWAATYALLGDIYPYRSTIVIGFTETATGLGGMVGPALAAYLASAYGFGFPCAIVGGMLLLQVITLPLALRYKRKPRPHLHHLRHNPDHPGHNLERRFEKALVKNQQCASLQVPFRRLEEGGSEVKASDIHFLTPQPEGKSLAAGSTTIIGVEQVHVDVLPEAAAVATQEPTAGIQAGDEGIPQPRSPSDEPYPPLTVRALLNTTVITCGLTVLVAEITATGITPFLAMWLEEKYDMSLVYVGYLLTVSSAAYGILAPVTGHITHRWGSVQTMLVGVFLLTLGYLILGPVPPLESLIGSASFPYWARVTLLVVAMLCEGCGVALAFVPALPTMMSSVYDLGPSATGAISGSFYALFSVGQSLGPFLGELFFWLTGQSFEWTAAILGLLALPLGPMLLLGRRDITSDDDATFELYDEETEAATPKHDKKQISSASDLSEPLLTASLQSDSASLPPLTKTGREHAVATQERLVSAAINSAAEYGSFVGGDGSGSINGDQPLPQPRGC